MVQPIAQAVGAKQAGGVGDGFQPPDQGGVIGGDEAKRGKAVFLHPFGQQKAEGLLGVAACKTIDAQMFAPVMREAFDQQAAGFGQARDLALQGEPLGGVGGKIGPAGLLENVKNPVGQQGGGGEFGAVEDGHLGVAAGLAGDLDRHFPQAFIAHDLAADQEGIAGGEGGGEGFFDLAQGGAEATGFSGGPSGFRCR